MLCGDALRVLGRDADLAGLGLGVGELERQCRPAAIGMSSDAVLGLRGALGLLGADGGQAARVLARDGRGLGHVRRDIAGVVAGHDVAPA